MKFIETNTSIRISKSIVTAEKQLDNGKGPNSQGIIDYYSILQVSRNATLSELKQIFNKLFLQFHPDKNNQNTNETWIMLKKIYDTLMDPEKRKKYDESLAVKESSRNSNEDYHLRDIVEPLLLMNSGVTNTNLVDRINEKTRHLKVQAHLGNFGVSNKNFIDLEKIKKALIELKKSLNETKEFLGDPSVPLRSYLSVPENVKKLQKEIDSLIDNPEKLERLFDNCLEIVNNPEKLKKFFDNHLEIKDGLVDLNNLKHLVSDKTKSPESKDETNSPDKINALLSEYRKTNTAHIKNVTKSNISFADQLKNPSSGHKKTANISPESSKKSEQNPHKKFDKRDEETAALRKEIRKLRSEVQTLSDENKKLKELLKNSSKTDEASENVINGYKPFTF